MFPRISLLLDCNVMSLFTQQDLRQRTRSEIRGSFDFNPLNETYENRSRRILASSINDQSDTDEYDIFLSHSSRDAELVMGLKLMLEDIGYSVYVDWIEDRQLDRTKVDRNTALVLKERMDQCRSLIYAFTENAANSKWMPWELGYFDGTKGLVAVLPITDESKEEFVGFEYLGIYYYIQIDENTDHEKDLWVHDDRNTYVSYNAWLAGTEPQEQ